MPINRIKKNTKTTATIINGTLPIIMAVIRIAPKPPIAYSINE